MKINRREVLKLWLAGSGALLSSFGVAQKAAAAEICVKEPQPPNTKTPSFSPRIKQFQQPLYIPEKLQPAAPSKTYPSKVFDYDEAEITQQCTTAPTAPICANQAVDRPIDYYEITMRKQKLPILSDPNGTPLITAEFWTYQGTGAKSSILGPLIRQPKERASCVRFINELGNDAKGEPICTSVHLHGMASLPQYDGYAEDLIPPKHYKDYYYPNNRASILWYHDHAVHKTSRNVYMGLAGMYIVEYGKEDFCNPDDFGCLPKDECEIPLILQDKTFEVSPNSHEWKLVFNDRQHHGVYADVVLVNGVPFPHLKVKRRKYYFRLLNASTSRTYQLALSGDPVQLTRDRLTQNGKPPEITVIATDAGLLAAPVYLKAPNQPLRIGMAERYSIVIDFSVFRPDVKHVYLRNLAFPSNLGTEAQALMRFDLEDGEVSDDSYIPKKLGKLTWKEEMNERHAEVRTFQFGRGRDWTINGKTWSPARVDADPDQCGIEVWNLVNAGGWVHPVHIHLIDFQILDRNGLEPPSYERGWKDVVLLHEFETVRVVARFGPHRGKYMMHCHNLVHEDHDMMNQFEVGTGGPDPLSDRAKSLPAPPLGSTKPPILLEECLPCACFEQLPNSCSEERD